MMKLSRYRILHNWLLKIVSLLLAALLWAAISNQTSSEIGFDVPLEYRNIPPQMEITGDMPATVQVRLRGSPNLIKGVTARDVSTTIDLGKMRMGEKIVPLSPQNVLAPFGAEVIRVNPSSVRFTLERTITKRVAVQAAIVGEPGKGYTIGHVVVRPSEVEVEGPESRVNSISSITTVPIRLDRKEGTVEQTADLDVPDPQIRLPRLGPINVRIEIEKQ
jgi:YbbR domain-containing protein